jgi:3-methyladenine DNA glycosylase AlkD
MSQLIELKKELNLSADPGQAAVLQRFFKTGKGQYGAGDIFLGIKVPIQRQIAKKYSDLPFSSLQTLLNSKIHEYRLIALIILTRQFDRSEKGMQDKIYNFYLRNYNRINNWDLVDLSAPNIVGRYLRDKPRRTLYEFARSENIWKKRIAIIATFTFIRDGQYADTLKIAEILIGDKHDLIHKAVGWMLREAGKRQESVLTGFLDKFAKIMPRTMLRYAIEKLPEAKRKHYLSAA